LCYNEISALLDSDSLFLRDIASELHQVSKIRAITFHNLDGSQGLPPLLKYRAIPDLSGVSFLIRLCRVSWRRPIRGRFSTSFAGLQTRDLRRREPHRESGLVMVSTELSVWHPGNESYQSISAMFSDNLGTLRDGCKPFKVRSTNLGIAGITVSRRSTREKLSMNPLLNVAPINSPGAAGCTLSIFPKIRHGAQAQGGSSCQLVPLFVRNQCKPALFE
jgi:hypothetical protein